MQSTDDMQKFLRCTDVIDCNSPEVKELARSLSHGGCGTETAKRCFDWVRDEIPHSFDVDATSVTCNASDTLRQRTGICYAKTHLLAAILRENLIPTGFGYQRIALDESGSTFCLHGFNYVHLDEFGWYPVDPRGNRDGISTVFDPPNVHLAFPIRLPGEETCETVFADPLESTISSLRNAETVAKLRDTLPDWIKGERN